MVANATRFPSGMKALGDFIHSLGGKFGATAHIDQPNSLVQPLTHVLHTLRSLVLALTTLALALLLLESRCCAHTLLTPTSTHSLFCMQACTRAPDRTAARARCQAASGTSGLMLSFLPRRVSTFSSMMGAIWRALIRSSRTQRGGFHSLLHRCCGTQSCRRRSTRRVAVSLTCASEWTRTCGFVDVCVCGGGWDGGGGGGMGLRAFVRLCVCVRTIVRAVSTHESICCRHVSMRCRIGPLGPRLAQTVVDPIQRRTQNTPAFLGVSGVFTATRPTAASG
jgi:hypothetical protein